MADLDSLISGLDKRLAEYANPSSRGTCGKCKKDIHGRMIEAMKNTWHEECWQCNNCGKLIGTDDFYPHNNYALCEKCEKDKFLPECHACRKPIDGPFTEALDRKYHPEHFTCEKCKKHLADGSYYPHEGQHLCAECAA